MIKSVSLKNLVLFIRVMLWGRVRRWYGVTVCWGRYGWRTWLELVLTRRKKSRRQQYWTVRRWGACRFCSSPTVCCDVATNQGVRGRQLNTFQTTMVPRTGCARWLLRGKCLAATWSACRASAALASRTACWIRMTAAQSRDQLPSTCSLWRRGLANWIRSGRGGGSATFRLAEKTISSCLGLAISCCLPPMLAVVQSHCGMCPLRRPAQPDRCHPQT